MKPFFKQPRAGKEERVFWILKFRSMKDRFADSTTDQERLNGMGKFIRKTSLDELPQLVNVLMGDMSLVGPRPLYPEYTPYYTMEEKKRLSVKPGITGLAQVSGRNKLDWGERLKLDSQYTMKISFLVDLKILFKTVFEIFKFSKSDFRNQQVINFIEYASRR